MMPTLFHIPNQVAGIPVFGAGWLLALWAVVSLILVGWLIWRQGFTTDTWSNIPLLVVIGLAIWFLLPRLTDAQGLPIRGYGVMVLLGTVLGTLLAMWRGQRRGVSSDTILSMVFWMFIPGVIGARLFYVIQFWSPEFQRPTFYETFVAVLNITEGGLVVYGSLLGGFAGLAGYLWKYRMPWLATFDLFAPAVMLGMALGRIGCLMNGCCFGGVCDLPWAVRFPVDSPVFAHQVESGEIFLHGLKVTGAPEAKPVITAVQAGSPAEQQGLQAGQTIATLDGLPIVSVYDAHQVLRAAASQGTQLRISTNEHPAEMRFAITPLTASTPVHPTQIYSVINNLLLCLFLVLVDPFCRRDGELFAWVLTLYPITRFLLEAIRAEDAVFGTGLSIAQLVSLLLLLTAVGIWTYVLRRTPGRAPFPASLAS